ncbi:MAG TPA: aldehyde dehydrogenase family protein, partial [Saprospiraceae bacterium]|nr:aldehyde dehydrogenase family protein [Saprospiraceae bacterium]
MIQLSNYINGQQVPPLSSTWLDNYEPATGQVYSRIPDSDGADVETAYQAARAAFPAWSTTPLEERYRILIRVSELIDHHLEELAEAESRDNGKPVWLARKVDIPRA